MSSRTASDDQRDHFISLLKKFPTAMLVTNTGEHGIHARPMVLAQVEDDGRVWFITCRDSAKIHEIEQDSHVNVIAQDGKSAFLSLTGRALLVGDRAKIAELWQEAFRVWFPGGKDDPEIELIAVRPERGEFWDNTGANGSKYLWDAALAYITGTKLNEDDGDLHATVNLSGG